MKRAQVRRLPVVNKDGQLVGLVSVADLAQVADGVRPTEVLEVLKAVSTARVHDGAPHSAAWLD